ncbi:MAG: anaerobic ribonucleoside-triphosphate reductase [Ruminococcus sp.]
MKITVKGGKLPQKEIDMLIEQLKRNNPDKYITGIEFTVDGDYVDVNYKYEVVPFERIRRITGYLVGGLDRFNDAKRSEVEDRVKHNI